jgi:ketosteroid isomerase-like protein
MKHIILALALTLSGCAGSLAPRQALPAAQAATTAPVIAAERAFAARAGEIGWIPAFCEFSANDAQLVGQGGLSNAHERMCALPDDGERNLFWAPVFAGVARSGDLGFTTGPASFDAERTPAIQYFTVWRRQPDGSWKWIYDGGPGPIAEPGPYLAEGVAPLSLPIAATGAGAAAAAVAEVSAIEAAAANAGALASYVAEDAHVYRAGQARAYGGAASATAMGYPSSEVRYRVVRAEGSEAGDMVFTLGEANWVRDDAPRRGFFARIWQHRPEGWRIVYDQLVGGTAPPPPAN